MHHMVMSKKLVKGCSTLAFVHGPDVMSAQTRNLLSRGDRSTIRYDPVHAERDGPVALRFQV